MWGYSERADAPIEPRLSEQWFLRYPKVDEALAAVRSGTIRFTPERWTKVYEHWMTNIQDWCISRQLWWGHRIPVWYHRGDPAAAACRHRSAARSGELEAGRGRPRHVVQFLALAVRDDGRADPREVLPDKRPRHRARHHFPLGGPDDHGGS